jgi:hypothetical protein
MGKYVRTSFLEIEYGKSPVPILECSNAEWRGVCLKKHIPFGNGIGGYYFGMEAAGLRDLIVIQDSLPNYKKLSVYYHEISHYECRNVGCKCFDDITDGTCEHHAHIGCMEKCLKSGSLWSLAFAMRSTVNFAIGRSQCTPDTRAGAAKTLNHGIWEECRRAIGGMYRNVVGHGKKLADLTALFPTVSVAV